MNRWFMNLVFVILLVLMVGMLQETEVSLLDRLYTALAELMGSAEDIRVSNWIGHAKDRLQVDIGGLLDSVVPASRRWGSESAD